MSGDYRDGHVQDALSHLLAMGMQMDQTRQIDVFVFNEQGRQLPEPATAANHDDYVRRHISHHVGGGTDYSPVIHLVYQHYYPTLTHLHTPEGALGHVASLAHHGHGLFGSLFGHHKPETPPAAPVLPNPADHDPVLMLFLTDGDNSDEDKEPTRAAIHAASGLPLFWSFVGLNHNSRFLAKLAEEADAEFVLLEDGVRISDDDLYSQLITPKMGQFLAGQHR
jgi:hypothetical protein